MMDFNLYTPISKRLLTNLQTLLLTGTISLTLPLASFAHYPTQLATFSQTKQHVSHSPWGQTALASQYLRQGQLEPALPHLKAAVSEDPKHLVAYYLWATTADDLAHQVKNPDVSEKYTRQAQAAFEKTVLLNPKILSATLRLGKLAMEHQHYDEAVNYYQQALAVLPDNPVLHFNLANVYDEQGNHAKAITEYETTIALDKSFTYAYNNVGLLYEANNQTDKAVMAFQKAIELKADYTFARLNLGQLYTNLGKYADANKQFRQALVYEPENSWAYLYLGNLHVQQENFPKAEVAYRQSITHQPDFAPAYYLLAAVLEKQALWSASQDAAERYLSLAPNGQFADSARQLVQFSRLQQVQPVAINPTENNLPSNDPLDTLHGYVSAP